MAARCIITSNPSQRLMTYTVSSKLTVVYKFIFPALAVYLAVWSIYGWLDLLLGFSDPTSVRFAKALGFSIFTVFFAVMAFWLCLPLKSVRIQDDYLIVSNFLKEIRVPVSEVSVVTGPDMTSLQRIEIHLRNPSAFGRVIIVMPGFLRATNVANYLREVTAEN